MKTSRLLMPLSLAIALLFAFGAGCRKSDDSQSSATPALRTPVASPGEKAKPKIDYWTCSMHPQIRAEKPGNCPICGMTLVPVRSISQTGAAPNPTAFSKGEVRLDPEAVHQAGVRVGKASHRPLSREITVFGTLGYNLNRHHDVVSLVEGRVERYRIDINQTEVARDAPLVDLYSVEAMNLQEDYLKALRERWLSTFYERNLLASVVTLAEEKLRRLGFTGEDLARLRRERKPKVEITVRAPIAGTIVDNLVRIGEIVKAGQTLYHIVPLDELWFNGQVFEPDLGLLQIGQKIRITTKAEPGHEYVGKLIFIGRLLDASNRTVLVRFAVPNPDRKLLPNLSANGLLEVSMGSAVLSVPNSAVLDLGIRHVVYVQKNENVYVLRDVRVGRSTSRYTEILEGLSENEPVVVAGTFLIDAQAQLRGESGGEIEGKPGTQAPPPVTEKP